jgi:hypothetical protein
VSGRVTLPLFGYDDEQRFVMVVQWFAKPVARVAMELEPEAKSVFFSVGRVVRDGVVRTEHRFVLASETSPRWPFASSPKYNALLDDGRSDRAARAAQRALFGADELDLGHEEGAPFDRAFSPYTRDPRAEDASLSSAFAPIVLIERRDYPAGDWSARYTPFGLAVTPLATVLSPERIAPPARPASDDPREFVDPISLLDLAKRGEYLGPSLDRARQLAEVIERYRADPGPDTMRALRQLVGLPVNAG